jgi:hypothetical protein
MIFSLGLGAFALRPTAFKLIAGLDAFVKIHKKKLKKNKK